MLAAAAAACPPDGEIVEIGSFRGLSTIVLATARARGRGDRRHRPARRQRPRAAGDRRVSPPRRPPTGSPSSATSSPPACAIGSATSRPVRPTPTARSTARSTCCTSTAPTATGRPGPTSATGDARVADGGTLLIHDAFSSVGVTAAIVRELVFGRRFRYVGRSRSLAEYRADLAGAGPAGTGPQRRRPARPARLVRPQRRPQGAADARRRQAAARGSADRVPEWPY